jgi:hypothetical protein
MGLSVLQTFVGQKREQVGLHGRRKRLVYLGKDICKIRLWKLASLHMLLLWETLKRGLSLPGTLRKRLRRLWNWSISLYAGAT